MSKREMPKITYYLLASSATREGIQHMICRFFVDDGYQVSEDLTVTHRDGRELPAFRQGRLRVVHTKGHYRFERRDS